MYIFEHISGSEASQLTPTNLSSYPLHSSLNQSWYSNQLTPLHSNLSHPQQPTPFYLHALLCSLNSLACADRQTETNNAFQLLLKCTEKSMMQQLRICNLSAYLKIHSHSSSEAQKTPHLDINLFNLYSQFMVTTPFCHQAEKQHPSLHPCEVG